MKAILLFISLVFAADSVAGLPPTSTRGQAETTNATTFNFQAPNYQYTKISATGELVETGNMNLLQNPGFEHSTYTTGWATSGDGTFSAETSTLISGKKAFKAVLSSQSVQLSQTSSLYASQLGGTQGYIQMSCKNTVPSTQLCALYNGVASTTDCVTLSTDNTWKQYEIPIVFDATSNGVQVQATSQTGTLICDDAYLGQIAGKTPEVSQAQLAGEAYIPGTASCQWTRTSTTVAAFATVAACPGPTIVDQSIGSWQTTDSDLPRFTVNSLPAGKYLVRFTVFTDMGAAGSGVLAISDGTTTCEPTNVTQLTTAGASAQTFECSFTYTSAGNRSFEIFGGATGTGQIRINNSTTTPRASLKMVLEYFPPDTKIYSQANNNDFGWSACTFTGSWVTNATYAALCRRRGDILDAQVRVSTSGAPTAAALTLTLPNSWTIDTAKLASSTFDQDLWSGGVVNDSGSVGYWAKARYNNTTSVIVQSQTASGTYLSLSDVTATIPVTFGAGDFVNVQFSVPISGWASSNQINGSFVEMMRAPGISKPAIYKAKLAPPSAGSCVVSGENADWITGNCTSGGTGQCSCTIISGKFASTPSCWANHTVTLGNVGACSANASSATSAVSQASSGGATANVSCELFCMEGAP